MGDKIRSILVGLIESSPWAEPILLYWDQLPVDVRSCPLWKVTTSVGSVSVSVETRDSYWIRLVISQPLADEYEMVWASFMMKNPKAGKRMARSGPMYFFFQPELTCVEECPYFFRSWFPTPDEFARVFQKYMNP